MHVNFCQVGEICCWQCDKISVMRWVIWVSHSESAYALTLTICSNNNYHCILGLCSPIGKTCYRQISRRVGTARMDVMINVSLWNTGYIQYISTCTVFVPRYIALIVLLFPWGFMQALHSGLPHSHCGMIDLSASNVNVNDIYKIDHYQTTTKATTRKPSTYLLGCTVWTHISHI